MYELIICLMYVNLELKSNYSCQMYIVKSKVQYFSLKYRGIEV